MLQEEAAKVEWEPYVPTAYERLLCVYYSVTMTIWGTIWRFPLDALKLLRVVWPLIVLEIVLCTWGFSTPLFYGLLILQLVPSALRICKGIFYPVCAGYALGHTWKQKVG